ncbi:MAG: substrate-binding domain-containing protein [Chloroflexota bacterium]
MDKKKIPTIGVLAGQQAYYGTILGKFVGPLLYGIQAAAKANECNLLIACGMEMESYSSATPAWPTLTSNANFVPVGPWNTDGLIVLNPIYSQDKSEYLQDLINDGFPVVFATKGEDGPTVAVDTTRAIHQALTHLHTHGHNQIAFIAGYKDDIKGDSQIRLDAFKKYSQKLGLAANPDLIDFGNHGITDGRRAMKRIINRGSPFTAVLASNDESAMGAMDVLKSSGYRIPEDVAVVGIDNIFEAIAYDPPLTTFHGSPYQIGYQAFSTLHDYLIGKTETLKSVDIPMQFVIRETCGCKQGLMSYVAADFEVDPTGSESPLSAFSTLVGKIQKTILIGVPQLSENELNAQSERLVGHFLKSISPQIEYQTSFVEIFEHTLHVINSSGGDIYILNDALHILKSEVNRAHKELVSEIDPVRLDRVFSEAGQTLLKHLEHRNRESILKQAWLSDLLGRINAQLLNVLNEAEVYDVLAEFLPDFGLEQISVSFLEGNKDDPVAYTRLRKVTDQVEEFYFSTREFPPRGLYSEPYDLVLLPLVSSVKQKDGFVVFNANQLELCAKVVLRLMTFFKTAHLYSVATEARRLAESANRSKSEFLSNMSHELRTPLNAIIGYSEFIKETVMDEQTQLYNGEDLIADINKIEASGRHLLELINNILDLSKIDEGKDQLNIGSYLLTDIIDEVTLALEPQILTKGLNFEVEFTNNDFHDHLIQVDKLKIQQILINLLANAAKFTDEGHISLTVYKQQKAAEQAEICFVITDTGIGIDAAFLPHLFDRFDQEDGSLTRKHDGAGLGLAICKQLVQMMDGTITIQSQKSFGSTFVVTIPTTIVPAPSSERISHA